LHWTRDCLKIFRKSPNLASFAEGVVGNERRELRFFCLARRDGPGHEDGACWETGELRCGVCWTEERFDRIAFGQIQSPQRCDPAEVWLEEAPRRSSGKG